MAVVEQEQKKMLTRKLTILINVNIATKNSQCTGNSKRVYCSHECYIKHKTQKVSGQYE